MIREPFASLEAMLSIEAIGALEERTVSGVEVDSWTPRPYHAFSGCEFLKVRSLAPSGSRDYIVKRSSFAIDLVRRVTDDRDCRERQVWQYGLLDRLPTGGPEPDGRVRS